MKNNRNRTFQINFIKNNLKIFQPASAVEISACAENLISKKTKMDFEKNTGNNLNIVPDGRAGAGTLEPEEKRESGAENIEESLKDYFFGCEEKFEANDWKNLAKLEGEFTKKQEKLKWSREKEIERCNLKKKLMLSFFEKNPKEAESYWKKNQREYDDYFGRGRNMEEKTRSFELLKQGVLNEIIANKMLAGIGGFKFKITSSEADIDLKIDTLGYSNSEKKVVAVQIKQGSKERRINMNELVREINGSENKQEEKDFFSGCISLDKDLKEKGGDEIEVKKIWISIPRRYRVGDGGNFEYGLGKSITGKVREIIEKE